jgi:uncharacterized protein YbjT (DUF2867 family)
MRILFLGANGFIGSRVLARLLADGHEVRAAVRDPARLRRRFPPIEAVRADLNALVDPEGWRPLLRGVEAVVNCAGALQSGRGQSLTAIHERAPAALYQACVGTGCRRIIHLSAISADPSAGTEYARTKNAGERRLMAFDLNWVILRPSLVYGPGSHGGTSLLRALAAFPLLTPLPGRGDQPFQPIHIDDLADAIALLLRDPGLSRITLEPVGPERLDTAEIVRRLRAWLGLKPAPVLAAPMALVRAGARIGDFLGSGPLRTTSVRQMLHGNAVDPAPFTAATGIHPRRMSDALLAQPSTVQDLWHARLYFLRPLLRLGLALFWLWTGLAALLWMPRAAGDALFRAAGVPESLLAPTWIAGGLIDLTLGVWLLLTSRVQRVGAAMLAISAAYLGLLAYASPELWLEPLGGLAKTPLVMLATLALMAIAEER